MIYYKILKKNELIGMGEGCILPKSDNIFIYDRVEMSEYKELSKLLFDVDNKRKVKKKRKKKGE